jgi:hypothetical protein
MARYPLTEEGWAAAWREFVRLAPDREARVRTALAKQAGWAEAAARDRERAAREEQERRDAQERTLMIHAGLDRNPDEFLGLCVIVQKGEVLAWSTKVVRVLGPLAGAQAGIAGPVKTTGAGTAVAATAAFGVIGAVGALAVRGTKPFAYVVFPDGTLHQNQLTDKKVAARAQADVLRFNALAAAPG